MTVRSEEEKAAEAAKARARRAKKHEEYLARERAAYPSANARRRTRYALRVEEERARMRTYSKTDRMRIWRLCNRYDLSPTEAEKWLAVVLCQACGEDPATDLDHVHRTDGTLGGVRGRLCHGCNLAEGLLKGSPERARKLAEYLERTVKENIR